MGSCGIFGAGHSYCGVNHENLRKLYGCAILVYPAIEDVFHESMPPLWDGNGARKFGRPDRRAHGQ